MIKSISFMFKIQQALKTYLTIY